MAAPSSVQVGRVIAAMVGLLGGASVGFWMQVLLPRTGHGALRGAALCSCPHVLNSSNGPVERRRE